jgi:hypothetical protein
MKTVVSFVFVMMMLVGVCSAKDTGLIFVGEEDGIYTYMGNTDIYKCGSLYGFNMLVDNTNIDVVTAMGVIVNTKEKWYVITGTTVQLKNGTRLRASGSPHRLQYGENSPVDLAIKIIRSRGLAKERID